MLDLQRLELENFSKRLVVFDTVPGDQGLYEADVHTLDGGILTVGFIVGTFGEFTTQHANNVAL